MSLQIQFVVAVLDIIALLYIGNLIRVKRLELKYALIWFLVGFLLLIFDLRVDWIESLSRLLGITIPINMLFFLGFGFVLLIIFSQTVVISNLTRRTKNLTQEVGLLNKRIDDMIEAGCPAGRGVFLDDEHKSEAREDYETNHKKMED